MNPELIFITPDGVCSFHTKSINNVVKNYISTIKSDVVSHNHMLSYPYAPDASFCIIEVMEEDDINKSILLEKINLNRLIGLYMLDGELYIPTEKIELFNILAGRYGNVVELSGYMTYRIPYLNLSYSFTPVNSTTSKFRVISFLNNYFIADD